MSKLKLVNEISLDINAASSLLQCHPQFGFKCIEGNDEAIKYYTGLTGYANNGL